MDDCSTDQTWKILEELAARLPELLPIQNESEHGYGRAVIRGLDCMQGDAAVIMMADESDDCRDVVRYWEKLNEGYDCVFGSRFCDGGTMQGPTKRRIISRGGTALTNLLLGTRMQDMTSGFEMFSRSALQEVLDKGIHSRAHFFQTEIRAHCRRLRVAEVPIRYRVTSNSVNRRVVIDALANLGRLFRLRLAGRL